LNIQDFAAIAEIVGAVAVVVSLIYLAIQIRQNTKQVEEHTRAVRAAALHASLSYGLDTRISVFTSGEVASIYARGLEDPGALNEMELLRFRLAMASIVDTFLNMYSQTKMSGFSPETWEAQAKSARRVLGTNGGRWFWSVYGSEYNESFRREVDTLLGENA
jgi:hypothetical protein